MTPDLYAVLQLSPDAELSADVVKQAYRRALLTHHPDKTNQITTNPQSMNHCARGTPSVDEIVQAYRVLADPILRKSYDAALRNATANDVFHSGIEHLDLDDLEVSEHNGYLSWHKKCRCDSSYGYTLTEQDLEKADQEQPDNATGMKDILVQCQGCSLLIEVTFATVGN